MTERTASSKIHRKNSIKSKSLSQSQFTYLPHNKNLTIRPVTVTINTCAIHPNKLTSRTYIDHTSSDFLANRMKQKSRHQKKMATVSIIIGSESVSTCNEFCISIGVSAGIEGIVKRKYKSYEFLAA